MTNAPFLAALAAAIAVALSAPPRAEAQAASVSDLVQAELRPGWRSAEGVHMAALHLHLAEGWKTYWRAPGDAGIPPRFDWQGSHGIARVQAHWPRPVVFDQAGMRSIGYLRDLVLPLELTLRGDGPARVEMRIEIGICESICVPVSLRVAADLPSGGAPDPAITAALADRPVTAGAAGLTRAVCAAEPIADGLRVTADLDLPRLGASEVVVFELPDDSIWISEASSRRNGGRLSAIAEMVAPSGAPFALDRSALRITVLGEARAAELRGCPGP